MSSKSPNLNVKPSDDTNVRVVDAAKFVRKQWAMNADICCSEGGNGFT